ncbi:MAG: hypothetical protein JST85_22865 [Acidobacteria bacterium]|nr:hypothetical protein [Acidobacteriota bacterium]
MKPNSCHICGRQLKDPDSIARGFGPECAAKRAAFLATCGTSDEELSAIQQHESPTVSRWARNFIQDMRAGRIRQARQCIEAARHQAGTACAAAQSGLTVKTRTALTTSIETLTLVTMDSPPAVAVNAAGNPPVVAVNTTGNSITVAVNTVNSAPAVAANTAGASEPFITVREIERGGYYVKTPFKLDGFVRAFKRVVGGTWHPEKESWYLPASQLTWTLGALEYWFCIPVKVEPFPRAATTPAQPHTNQQPVGLQP